MCYVKACKSIIAICSVILRSRFLIRRVILVYFVYAQVYMINCAWFFEYIFIHSQLLSWANFQVIYLQSFNKRLFMVCSSRGFFYMHDALNIFLSWAKQTKLLLLVIYGSPRRHSNNFKTFEKIEIYL